MKQWGIYSDVSKRVCRLHRSETQEAASKRFNKKLCNDARKWRWEFLVVPDDIVSLDDATDYVRQKKHVKINNIPKDFR